MLADQKKTLKPKLGRPFSESPVGDVTRTKRAGAYLDRLTASEGKRVVVDLGSSEREALEGLLASGYAESQSAVIRKALLDAAKKKLKTT